MLIPTVLWFCAVASAAPNPSAATPQADRTAGERSFSQHGFAIAAPVDGWTAGPGRTTEKGFRVEIPLASSGGLVAVSVTSSPTGAKSGADARDEALSKAQARPEYRGHALLEGIQLAGAAAPAATLTWETATSGTFTVQQRYLVREGRAFLVQAYAPSATWADHENAFERIIATFRTVAPSSAEEAEASVAALAARCGSEPEWAPSWDAAAARAAETGRHVLIVMRAYAGFDLPDSTAYSTFMDEDVLAMVGQRLVPVRLSPSDPSPLQDRSVYGLSPTVLGVGLILMRADGTLIADTCHAEPPAVLEWLRTQLQRDPEPHDPDWPTGPLAAASLALDRGELGRAAAQLESLQSTGAHVLRARLHRLRRDPQSADAELRLAVEQDPALAPALACDRARIAAALGEPARARRLLAPLVTDPTAPEHAQAMLLMSFLAQSELGLSAARPLRRRIVRRHAASRWAWLAAAYLQLEPLLEKAGKTPGPRRAREDVLNVMVEPGPEPAQVADARSAEQAALRWLRAHQRPDGSWPGPNELYRRDGAATDAISAAVDALATRALLQRGPRHRDAAARGLAFLVADDARRRAEGAPVLYMDYTAWAAWAQLELISDALDAGVGQPEELRALGARLTGDLAERVRRNGGWSYYLSGDAAGETTVEQSISFTTAAAILGLVRAEGHGITVDPGLVDAALECLEGMRDRDGLFAYMVFESGAATRNPAPGAAGRGPACELALHAGGRSSTERLRRSLELFDVHADSLAAEVGKALMHAGAETQGCHYPFFDYLMAARAVSALGADAHPDLRTRILELILSARLEDGSFLDTPVIGPTFGTAAALLALHALGD